jgi:hypothetical protein
MIRRRIRVISPVMNKQGGDTAAPAPPPGPGGLVPIEEWGWTGELPVEDLRNVATVNFVLWRRGREWVNRRVETIKLLDVDTVAVRISIDFRIPTDLPGAIKLGTGETYVLPLTVLPRRRSLAYFDVTDEGGRSLPMLTRQENARITGTILIAAAQRALAEAPAGVELSAQLLAYLASIPTRGTHGARAFVEPVLEPENDLLYPDARVPEILLVDQDFRNLLGLCASCSFVHVPLDARPGERRIIKLSLLSPWDPTGAAEAEKNRKARWARRFRDLATWLGWRAEVRMLIMPQVGNAESFHAQISAPDRVEFTEAGMRNKEPAEFVKEMATKAPPLPAGPPPDDPNDTRGYQQFIGGIAKRKHIYIESSHAHRGGIIWVRFRVARHGFLRAAVAVGWLTALLLFAFALRGENVLGEAQTAAALLLLVPALIAGFLIGPGEHAMVRHLLRGPRILTALIGGLALVATAALLTLPAAEPSPAVPESLLAIWRIEAGAAALISVLLTISLLRPPAGRRDVGKPPADPQVPFVSSVSEAEAETEGNV